MIFQVFNNGYDYLGLVDGDGEEEALRKARRVLARPDVIVRRIMYSLPKEQGERCEVLS